MSGVYGISNAKEWIYIRDTDNIQESLLAHFEEENTILRSKRPTGFVFELCDRSRRPGRQDRLINEYQPSCNQQIEGRP